MVRWLVIMVCVGGWLILVAGVLTPLAGMILAGTDRGNISTQIVAVPSSGTLLIRSLTLSATATIGALLLGLLPAAILGSSGRRTMSVLMGLMLTPLLIPPQVYAYAWGLILAPSGLLGKWLPASESPMLVGGAVRAGLISAGWLWPVAAMILAAGWRRSGRTVYSLAILDTTPTRAFVRAVVPSLRPHLIAAACVTFAVTLIEYAIPHLTLSRVYATELLILVDAGAPAGQVMGMAVQVIAIVLILICLVAWSVRTIADRQSLGTDDEPAKIRVGYVPWLGSLLIWFISVGVPILVMVLSLRDAAAWREGFTLFAEQWYSSLFVSLTVGLFAVILAVGTIVLCRSTQRRWLRIVARLGALAALFVALMPPAVLGIGLVLIFNRPGFGEYIYGYTPWVWILSLSARYGAVAVLVAWLAIGQRSLLTVDQARTDGADSVDVLTHVLLPMVRPALLAAGLIIVVLSLFEVIVTQLVGPIGFPSIAMALLGQMHYGRDDVVITTSLIVVAAGIIAAQICSWLLLRVKK